MVSIPVAPLCELARWVLDHHGIPYVEETHIPVFHAFSTRAAGGTNVVPVVVVAEGPLTDARAVVHYVESRCRDGEQLAENALYDHFSGAFGTATRAWAYAYMLARRAAAIRSWSAGGESMWERIAVRPLYPLVAWLMRKSLEITPRTITERQAEIDATFDRVDALLADGRRFLAGDQLTLADVSFAAFATPVVMPENCPSPFPPLADLPPPMREAIESYRSRPAGQFVSRMYREHRPAKAALFTSPNRRTMSGDIIASLTATDVLRPILGLLRAMKPVLTLGKKAIVTSHAGVVDVLTRDTDFTISQINAPRIDRLDGPFILGMDRSPEYDREEAALRAAVKREDMATIRETTIRNAARMLDAARDTGRIDVVGSYARPVAARLVASYFGIPGTSEPALMRWMRYTFQDVFLNVGNDQRVIAAAAENGRELHAFMDALITAREQNGSNGDDIVSRLVRQKAFDHNGVRRNVGGLIVGAVDTTSKFVTLAINQLLERPTMLQAAAAAAQANDIELVRHYTWEAVRFDPHNAFLLRYAPRDTKIGTTPIAADSYVLVSVLSAMFDPAGFPKPREFRVDRDGYLHFGYGMHTCFGVQINAVQIPELVAGLLRLPNLRRGGAIEYDGPFPEHLIVEFDRRG